MTSKSGKPEALPDSSSQPEAVADVWTDRRLAILEWLESAAPSLAELYQGAVQLLDDPGFAGRLRFIAHGVRDVRNRLPDVVAGFERPARFEWKNRLDAFAKIWKPDGPGALLAESHSVDSTTEIHVKVRVVREVDLLVRDFTASRETVEAAAVRLFQALAPENEAAPEDLRPVIRQWLKVTDWFLRNVHDPGVPADVDEDELVHNFELFESGLASLIEAFYKPVDDLDDILEEANA
jgi:hypothetical protein